MRKKKKLKKRKFQVVLEYTLDDLICDPDDPEEVEYLSKYVGKYILRRMTFGDQRLTETSMVRIQTKIKEKSVEIEDVVPDISNWQINILTHSIYECPFGKRPSGGWKKDPELTEFIYNLPNKIGSELLEIALEINGLNEDEIKN